jgi:hypothetical protein
MCTIYHHLQPLQYLSGTELGNVLGVCTLMTLYNYHQPQITRLLTGISRSVGHLRTYIGVTPVYKTDLAFPRIYYAYRTAPFHGNLSATDNALDALSKHGYIRRGSNLSPCPRSTLRDPRAVHGDKSSVLGMQCLVHPVYHPAIVPNIPSIWCSCNTFTHV